ncbi:serine/threonine-protein phosphatase [Yamadazyma tenuis]|nr:serine/threonine-protein phosphatase [Yamadazyma tenuis]
MCHAMQHKRSLSLFNGARHYFLSRESEDDDLELENPYIQYPVVTRDQMNRVAIDKYKFDFSYASFSFHSTKGESAIHSLSDLSDPTSLNTLLPRRRPHGSPADTLSIKAGDDAMLVSPTVLGVADGVSGWESKGEHCSSGVWSRSMLETLSRLLTEYKIAHYPHNLNKRDIDQIIDDSYLHTSHLMDLQNLNGSSTLVLCMLSGEYLKMISIGDSKLFVIRDGQIVKTNEEQLISELCPKQIGTQTLTQLPSEMAWVDAMKLQENDVILLCSDGITDNLYEDEINKYLNEYLNEQNLGLRQAAQKLLSKAKEIAFDDYAFTPYNEKVNALPKEKFGNKSSCGGKLDDMSICLARVVPNQNGGQVKA